MHKKGFESVERLYEHFLLDPGMEPVVQTSRIQLAISSVQQFIQRCLLNLEQDVAPSMIDARQWQWMKRYRVWEANRRIFLFPENWLEPEFRDDKTYLFQELESALLQGDVSRELVEDAFNAYLTELETIARLDIVTMYREEDPEDPETYTLHVIGRTIGPLPKYFYRRYTCGMWTPWERVTVNIEGDLVVAVVWRQRLHLFWLTPLDRNEPTTSDSDESYEDRAGGSIADSKPNTRLEFQLNCCEHFQGKWRTPRSYGFDNDNVVSVTVLGANPDKSKVFIHVTTGFNQDTVERSTVLIHLWLKALRTSSIPIKTAFRMTSKNSNPMIVTGEDPSRLPYNTWTIKETTRYKCLGPLQLTFETTTLNDAGIPITVTLPTQDILGEGETFFSLLFSSNLSDYSFSETKGLLSQYFYQDSQNTFFVDPVLIDPDLNHPEEAGIFTIIPGIYAMDSDDWWRDFPVFRAKVYEPPRPPDSPEQVLIDPIARYSFLLRNDWATDLDTVIQFDDSLIGSSGALGGDGRISGSSVHGLKVIAGQGVNHSMIMRVSANRESLGTL
jgi:hypothetical protein